MLCKCSGKYIDIYFILKITFLKIKIKLIHTNSPQARCHTLPTGINKYLYPNDMGQTVDLDFDGQEVNDFNNIDGPAFKAPLVDDNLCTKNKESLRTFTSENLKIFENKKFGDVAVEDLEVVGGFCNADIYPKKVRNCFRKDKNLQGFANQRSSVPADHKCAKNLQDVVDHDCEKHSLDEILDTDFDIGSMDTAGTDKVDDVNVLSVIQAGLLQANVILRGYNEAGAEDLTLTVGHENLNEIINSYGEQVTQYLKEMKVTPDHMALFKEQKRLKQAAVPVDQDELSSVEEENGEVVVPSKPEIIEDKNFPNKKKLIYGKVKHLPQDKYIIGTPKLLPSGGT